LLIWGILIQVLANYVGILQGKMMIKNGGNTIVIEVVQEYKRELILKNV